MDRKSEDFLNKIRKGVDKMSECHFQPKPGIQPLLDCYMYGVDLSTRRAASLRDLASYKKFDSKI